MTAKNKEKPCLTCLKLAKTHFSADSGCPTRHYSVTADFTLDSKILLYIISNRILTIIDVGQGKYLKTNLWMATAQCPARARGMASSKTSIEGDSQTEDSMFKQAKLLVHFHSFSCVATSSITSGTQPPKMNILKIKSYMK